MQQTIRILITGAGGREHSIGWKILQEHDDALLFFAPGNAGTASIGQNLTATTTEELLDAAKTHRIDLTIVGSEDLLADGVVDAFQTAGLAIFGPHQAAAKLESSKAFAKDFMQRHGIQTAKYANFTDFEEAKAYLQNHDFPVVIKASGLAAGKGVLICHDKTEAVEALQSVMLDKTFGSAGNEVVIEEFLEGFETSILSVCTGNEIVSWLSAMDHKQALDGDIGPNTGGMGVVAPHPFWSDAHQREFEQKIVQPTANGLSADNIEFNGFIFFGLMVTRKGIYLLEYNLRLGDPETQAILPLLENDFVEIITQSLQGHSVQPSWHAESTCVLVIAAQGYPGKYIKHTPIDHLEKLNIPFFLAGCVDNNHQILTNGGRILNLVGQGETLDDARQAAYINAETLALPNSFYRKDIGLRTNPLEGE